MVVTDAKATLDRVLDPAYLEGLDDLDLDDVRARHIECVELENYFSYVRRILQGHLDILTADARRRSTGGSLEDLVASLPEILADGGGRPGPATTRIVPKLAPEDFDLPQELRRAVDSDATARLATMSDEELTDEIETLRAAEVQVSGDRRSLHEVLDRLERDLASRLAVEA